MTDEMTPEEIAQEHSKPGKFSLIDRLRNRNMPSHVETIYLDDASAFQLLLAKEEHSTTTDKERLAELDAEIEALTARVKESAAEIHMAAITSERYDELIAETDEAYPVQYEIVENPFTGRKTRAEKSNPERDVYFNNLYLSEVIRKAVFDGDEDTDITVAWVEQFSKIAPLDAVRKVAEQAFKLRMVVEWMDEIQNEDLSLKP